jgi:hypothetical protein
MAAAGALCDQDSTCSPLIPSSHHPATPLAARLNNNSTAAAAAPFTGFGGVDGEPVTPLAAPPAGLPYGASSLASAVRHLMAAAPVLTTQVVPSCPHRAAPPHAAPDAHDGSNSGSDSMPRSAVVASPPVAVLEGAAPCGVRSPASFPLDFGAVAAGSDIELSPFAAQLTSPASTPAAATAVSALPQQHQGVQVVPYTPRTAHGLLLSHLQAAQASVHAVASLLPALLAPTGKPGNALLCCIGATDASGNTRSANAGVYSTVGDVNPQAPAATPNATRRVLPPAAVATTTTQTTPQAGYPHSVGVSLLQSDDGGGGGGGGGGLSARSPLGACGLRGVARGFARSGAGMTSTALPQPSGLGDTDVRSSSSGADVAPKVCAAARRIVQVKCGVGASAMTGAPIVSCNNVRIVT